MNGYNDHYINTLEVYNKKFPSLSRLYTSSIIEIIDGNKNKMNAFFSSRTYQMQYIASDYLLKSHKELNELVALKISVDFNDFLDTIKLFSNSVDSLIKDMNFNDHVPNVYYVFEYIISYINFNKKFPPMAEIITPYYYNLFQSTHFSKSSYNNILNYIGMDLYSFVVNKIDHNEYPNEHELSPDCKVFLSNTLEKLNPIVDLSREKFNSVEYLLLNMYYYAGKYFLYSAIERKVLSNILEKFKNQ